MTIPAVRQAAMACSRYSTGVGAWSEPTRTSGWSDSTTVSCRCCISWPAPKKPEYVDRLWVPRTQVLLARNRNAAISFCARTASSVANRVGTSTPLICGLAVMLMVLLHGCG